MDKKGIAQRVMEIAVKVAADASTELVHVETAGTNRDIILRIYIDKENGVTLDDCAAFSHAVEEVLDAEDVIPVRYVLEVSSPGIERELYSIKDFERFVGKLAKLKTNVEIDGLKTFVGTITGVDGDTVSIDERGRGPMTVNFGDIAKANLKIDLSKEFGGR